MDITFQRFVKPGDFHIRLKFTLKMSVYYDYAGEHMHMNLPKDELLYDELQFVIEGTVQNSLRNSFIKLSKYQLDHSHGNRHFPYRNKMDLTRHEYLEFLSHMSAQLARDKEYINKHLQNGIEYPLNVPEFYTFLYFDNNIMYHIFTKKEYTREEVSRFWQEEII